MIPDVQDILRPERKMVAQRVKDAAIRFRRADVRRGDHEIKKLAESQSLAKPVEAALPVRDDRQAKAGRFEAEESRPHFRKQRQVIGSEDAPEVESVILSSPGRRLYTHPSEQSGRHLLTEDFVLALGGVWFVCPSVVFEHVV
jgi:hypothetical protein